jgi:hypothetical protein
VVHTVNDYSRRRKGAEMTVSYHPDARPEIQWGHVDGPLLHLRYGGVHWLSFWERFQLWISATDVYKLERKHWGKV